MPLYEYLCQACDERFERYVRAWGEAVTCPACRSEACDKQLSTFAFAGGSRDPAFSSGGGCGCGRGGCGCAH